MWERVAMTVTVFGGGILLGALAFEIVPSADEHAGAVATALGLVGGALAFLAVDWLLTREEGRTELRRALQAGVSGGRASGGHEQVARGETIALGIFIDGVPETAALGVMIAQGDIGLALLTGVLVSNLVESYGATYPIVRGGRSRGFAILVFAGIALALVAAIVVGSTLLIDAHESVIGLAEAVAGGAIFATVSIAIIPHAFAEVSRWAAVAGMLGLVAAYLLA
jgi:ZIP family zinc transporter